MIYTVAGAAVTGVVILLLYYLLSARKNIRRLTERLTEVSQKRSEDSQKSNQQLNMRNDTIKRLLHEQYEPETLAFFIHLTNSSSYIPDSVFDKVEAHQAFIMKKKRED